MNTRYKIHTEQGRDSPPDIGFASNALLEVYSLKIIVFSD